MRLLLFLKVTLSVIEFYVKCKILRIHEMIVFLTCLESIIK